MRPRIPPPMGGAELRRSLRRAVSLQVAWRAGEGDWLEGRTLNLSHGGVFVETAAALPSVDDTVQVTIRLDGAAGSLSMGGRVRWTRGAEDETASGFGVRFEALDPDVASGLAALLASLDPIRPDLRGVP